MVFLFKEPKFRISKNVKFLNSDILYYSIAVYTNLLVGIAYSSHFK